MNCFVTAYIMLPKGKKRDLESEPSPDASCITGEIDTSFN